MSRAQKVVIFCGICFLILQMAFPPFHSTGDGKDTFWGYRFLPDSTTPRKRPTTGMARMPPNVNIDASLLFVQMVGSTLVFLGIFMLFHRGNEGARVAGRENAARSGSEQRSSHSEEFFDVGDDEKV